jgi:hypothetical protein
MFTMNPSAKAFTPGRAWSLPNGTVVDIPSNGKVSSTEENKNSPSKTPSTFSPLDMLHLIFPGTFCKLIPSYYGL